MKVVSDEIFGPVVGIIPYDDITDACETISTARFGLQTGVFTASIATAMQAVRTIRTGGVIINGTSTADRPDGVWG